MRLKDILVLFSFHLARDFCTVNAKKEVDHLFRSNIKHKDITNAKTAVHS